MKSPTAVTQNDLQAPQELISVKYDALETNLIIGKTLYSIQSLDSFNLPAGNILIDSTSLSFPEILHLFRMLDEKKRSFDILYIQPTDYKKNSSSNLNDVITYDLSDDGIGIQQLPPYIGMSANSPIFFFMGWEGHRLGALINSDEINVKGTSCLLGVPAFKLGWENRTLSSNYTQLMEVNNSSNVGFKYAGANDPIKTYELIERLHSSAIYDKKTLSIAPFGTKPTVIAAAQFAVNNSNIILLYDYVKEKIKRSSGADLLHIWTFETT